MKFKLIILILFFSVECFAQIGTLPTSSDSLITGLEDASDDEINENIAPASFVFTTKRKPPESFFLDKYLPYIGDQGLYQGSCTAFSVAAALTIANNQKIKRTFTKPSCDNTSYFISPSFIFNLAKAKYPPPRNQSCKIGITYIDAFLISRDIGSVSWEEFPYRNTSTTACYSNYPENSTISKAKNKLLVFQRADIDKDIFKYFLSEKQGYPICIAVKIDKNYYDAGFKKANNSTWVSKGPPVVGQANPRHALLVVGYDDTKNAFKVVDSRGCRWGNDGYIWLHYDLVNKDVVYDAYVCSFDDRLLGEEKVPGSADTDLITGQTSGSPKNTWLKAGYFRIFNGVRIVCLKIDKGNEYVEFQLKDNKTGRVLTNNIECNLSDSKSFTYQGNTYTINPYKIGAKGRNIFKPAVSFLVSLKEGDIMEEFKKGK
jgi:hypothetical protein